jgi:hypothetical protein
MPRKVFFSFHYDRDVVRVSQVRNSNVVTSSYTSSQFLDHASWESIKKNGESSIRKWIDDQLIGSTVTCVLIGFQTNERKWVHYEIEQSISRKNAILGILIHNMKNFSGSTDFPGFSPFSKHKIGNYELMKIAPTYDWVINDGYRNFGNWIDEAVNNFKRIDRFRG